MNTRIKSSLNNIKADEALVRKTEEYLRNTLAKEQNSKITHFQKRRVSDMKKILIAACAAVLLIGGGGKAYLTPLSYVSLDINPSVELGVNVFGQVVTAEGYNADGKTVLNGIKVTGTNVTKAVSTVVDSAVDKGFIADDGSSVISLTAETDNDSTATKLNADAEAGAKEALAENGKSADVIKDNVALARREQARVMGITPGKLNLIQKLQAVDPTATIEQYKDAKIKDIMKSIQSKTNKSTTVGNQNPAAGAGNQNSTAGAGNQ
ncbi:MAG: hypothetical protein GX434_06035, partial [Peptococcaceae bacterium]|nr:hypothetical protein [Peptococcaceae bacterium]